jgi:hypothetical protein
VRWMTVPSLVTSLTRKSRKLASMASGWQTLVLRRARTGA